MNNRIPQFKELVNDEVVDVIAPTKISILQKLTKNGADVNAKANKAH